MRVFQNKTGRNEDLFEYTKYVMRGYFGSIDEETDDSFSCSNAKDGEYLFKKVGNKVVVNNSTELADPDSVERFVSFVLDF